MSEQAECVYGHQLLDLLVCPQRWGFSCQGNGVSGKGRLVSVNGPLTSHGTHEEQAWSSIKRKRESLGHPSEPGPLGGTTECWPLHPLHDSLIPWKTSQSCLSFLTAAPSQPTFPPPYLPTRSEQGVEWACCSSHGPSDPRAEYLSLTAQPVLHLDVRL